jgi:type IV pilus assembly protein PilV
MVNILKNNKKEQDGFTVLEVLIAMLIFAIGIMGVGAMQLASIEGNASARDMSRASTVAVEQLEQLLNSDYDLIAAGTQVVGPNAQYPVQYTIDTTVDDAGTDGVDTKTVTIAVTWVNKAGVTQTVNVQQIVANVDR